MNSMNLKNNILFKINIILYIIFILTCLQGYAQQGNYKSGQWASVGGKMLLSGNHKFTESWTSDNESRQNEQYWKGEYYTPKNKRKYYPWNDVVKNSVSPYLGQITVEGPCNIGLYQRGMGAIITLIYEGTNERFACWNNTLRRTSENGNWLGTIKDFNPKGEYWGYIPKKVTVTLNVFANMGSYNNIANTQEFAYRAPQDIEYEVWFFPRGEGSKVINVSNEKPKTMAGFIQAIIGKGKICRWSGGKEVELKTGDKLYHDDIIISKDNALAKIILDNFEDKPLIMLKAGTKIQLIESPKTKKTGIFSYFGKLLFKGNGSDHHGFQIRTSNCITAVAGTMVDFEYNQTNETTTVNLFEGQLNVECSQGLAKPFLMSGKMQLIMKSNCEFTLSELTDLNNTPQKFGWPVKDDPEIIDTNHSVKKSTFFNPAPGELYRFDTRYKNNHYLLELIVIENLPNGFKAKEKKYVSNSTTVSFLDSKIRIERDCSQPNTPCFQVYTGEETTDGKYEGTWVFTDYPKGRGNWWSDTGTFTFSKVK